MKKIAVLIFGTLSVALAASYPMNVKDDLGNVAIPKKPSRIVAAHPISLELLLALGVQPVGYAGAPEGVMLGAPLKEIPRYTDLLRSEPIYVGNPLNFETTAALKPDLISSYNPNNADQERQLRNIAPTLLFNYAEGDGWQRAITPLAKALGKEGRAKELLAAVARQERQTKTLLAPVVGRGKTVALFGIIGKDIYSFGPEFPPARQLQRLGFGVTKAVSGDWKAISAEGILAAKADRALLLSYNPTAQVQQDALTFMRRANFKSIHTFEPEKVSRFTAGPLSDIQMLNNFVKVLSTKGVQ